MPIFAAPLAIARLALLSLSLLAWSITCASACDLLRQDCTGTMRCGVGGVCSNLTCSIDGNACNSGTGYGGVCLKPDASPGVCVGIGCGCSGSGWIGITSFPLDPIPTFGNPLLNDHVCRRGICSPSKAYGSVCQGIETNSVAIYQGPGTLNQYGVGRHVCTYFYNNTYTSFACYDTTALCVDTWVNTLDDPEQPVYAPNPSCIHMPGEWDNLVVRCSNYSTRVCDPYSGYGTPGGYACVDGGTQVLPSCNPLFQGTCGVGYYCASDNVCRPEPSCTSLGDCESVPGVAYTCYLGKCTHTSCGAGAIALFSDISGTARDAALCYEPQCSPDLSVISLGVVPTNPAPNQCVYNFDAGALAFQCNDLNAVCIPWYTNDGIWPGCRHYTGNFSLTTWCGYPPNPRCIADTYNTWPGSQGCLPGGTCSSFQCIYPTASPSSSPPAPSPQCDPLIQGTCGQNQYCADDGLCHPSPSCDTVNQACPHVAGVFSQCVYNLQTYTGTCVYVSCGSYTTANDPVDFVYVVPTVNSTNFVCQPDQCNNVIQATQIPSTNQPPTSYQCVYNVNSVLQYYQCPDTRMICVGAGNAFPVPECYYFSGNSGTRTCLISGYPSASPSTSLSPSTSRSPSTSPTPSASPFEFPCSYYNGTNKAVGTPCSTVLGGGFCDGLAACKVITSNTSLCFDQNSLQVSTNFKLYRDDGSVSPGGTTDFYFCPTDDCVGYCASNMCNSGPRPDGAACLTPGGTCYGGVCVFPSQTSSPSPSMTPSPSSTSTPSSSASRTPSRTPSSSPVYECSFGLGNPKPVGTPCTMSSCYGIPCSISTCNGAGACTCTTTLPQCLNDTTFVVTTFFCSRVDGGGLTSSPISYNYTSCDDGEACTLDTCPESPAGCVHTSVSNGEVCGAPGSGWMCVGGVCTAPTPTPSSSPSMSSTPSQSPSLSSSPSPSQSLTSSASTSFTPSPSSTTTSTASESPSSTNTVTASMSPTPSSTSSGSPSLSSSSGASTTPTSSKTPSPSETGTSSSSPSATSSSTASATSAPSASPVPVVYSQCGAVPDGTPCYTNNLCTYGGVCSAGLCVSSAENPGTPCNSGVAGNLCVFPSGTCDGFGRCVPSTVQSTSTDACNTATGALDHFRLCSYTEIDAAVTTELAQTYVDFNGVTQTVTYALVLSLNGTTLITDITYSDASWFYVSADCDPSTVCNEIVCQLYPEPTCLETPRNQGQLCVRQPSPFGNGVCAPNGVCEKCMYSYNDVANFQHCPSGSVCNAESNLCFNATTSTCISDSQCVAGHGWYAQCVGGSCQYESCQDYSGGASFTYAPPFQSTSQALCAFDCLHDIHPTQLSYVPVLPAMHQCVYTIITGTVAYECPSTILTCVPQFTLSALAPVCVETAPQISVTACSVPYQCSNTLGIACPPAQLCDSFGMCVQQSPTPSPSQYVVPSSSPSASPIPVHWSQCGSSPDGTPCYTNNPCLYGSVCSSGACVSSVAPYGAPCTSDVPYTLCVTGSTCDWDGRCVPTVLPPFQYTACNNATGALDYFNICYESDLSTASTVQLTHTYVDRNGVETTAHYATEITFRGTTLVTDDPNADATYYYDSPACFSPTLDPFCSNSTCEYNNLQEPVCVFTPRNTGQLCVTPFAVDRYGLCDQAGTCGQCRFYLEPALQCPNGTICSSDSKYCINVTQTCTVDSQCNNIIGWHSVCINGTCQRITCSGHPQTDTFVYPGPYASVAEFMCALDCGFEVTPSALSQAPYNPQPHQCVYTTSSGVLAYECPAADFVCVPRFDLTTLSPMCMRNSPYSSVSSCSVPYQCSNTLGITCPGAQVCTAQGTCVNPSTTPSITASVSPTSSPSDTPSPSRSPSSTNTASASRTPSESQTPSSTNTASASQTPSSTNTASSTSTPSTSTTPSASSTPSVSSTPSPTSTASQTRTASPSASPSASPFHCSGPWCCISDADCAVDDGCVISKCVSNQCYSNVKNCDDHNADTYDVCMHGQCFNIDNDVRGYCKYCKGMGRICSASTTRPEIDDDDSWPYTNDDHDWPDIDSCDECKQFTRAHLCAAAYSSSVLMPYCGTLRGSGYMFYFPVSPYAISYNVSTPPVAPWLFGPMDYDDTKFVRYGFKHAKLNGVVTGLNATTGSWAWKVNVRMTKVSSTTYTPDIDCVNTGVNSSLTDLYAFRDSTLVGVGTSNYGDRIKLHMSSVVAQVGPWANNMNGNIGLYFKFSWQLKKRTASSYGPWVNGGVVTADINPECKSPCKKPCYHGLCDADNGDCLCDDDWSGIDCNTPRTCLHGTYIPFINACMCSVGWTGKYCDIAYLKK